METTTTHEMKLSPKMFVICQLIFVYALQSVKDTAVLSAKFPATDLSEQCPFQCDCFNFDETVDCSHRGLEQLPLLSNVTRRLYLEDNQLTWLPDNAFYHAPSLSMLVLERNELTSLNTDAFCGLTRLQELDLGGNRIRGFGVAVCSAPTLKEINLSLNLLTAIPQNISHFAPNLEILNLSYNEIESALMDASFAGLVALRHLDLSRNRIHEILSEDLVAIRGIPLEILNLAECSLVNIEDSAFDSLGNLSSLSLANNLLNHQNLEKVLGGRFATNNNLLARLDLSEIVFPNLTLSMLGSFRELIILDASFCDVEYVQPELFDRLQNLETLHLEFGKLNRLENLSVLKKLRRVYLQDNRLTSIDLLGIFSLESIDLSYNQIEVIPALWLSGLRNLQILNLSHNHITSIESNALRQVAIISTLDISFNKIQVLRSYGLVRLAKLDASHNVIQTVYENALENLHQTLNEIDLSYNNLSYLSGAVFRRSHNVQSLNLAGNNLAEFLRSQDYTLQEKPFENLQLLRTLDLSGNAITRLGCEHLAFLHHLETLILQNNNIRQLNDLNLGCVKTVVKLILSANQLHQIDVDVFAEMENLDELDLSANPFDCNCSLVPFLRWVNETDVRIMREADTDRYRCNSPVWEAETLVFSYQPRPFDCPSLGAISPAARSGMEEEEEMEARRYMIVFSLTTAAGVVVGVALILLIWRYRPACQRLKLLNYRWQVRYREVSDLETAIDAKM